MIKFRIVCLGGVLVLGMMTSIVMADVQIQGSRGGGCFSVVSKITRNWSEVKRVMLPSRGKLRRAKSNDFYCISAQYTYQAMERRVSRSAELKCYTDPGGNGLGMCCDLGLNACAQLRRDLVPEAPRRVAKKKRQENSKPSSSSWMKVPTEDDQWKTPPPEE